MSEHNPTGRPFQIDRDRAAVLIIDIQERLSAAMPDGRMQAAARSARILAEMARQFQLPVVVSQQYPKGLGLTHPDVEESLEDLPELHRFDKTVFSACCGAAWDGLYDALERDQWVVIGMESHVCVYQSVRDLSARGAEVMVAVDGVVSRTEENRQLGIELMRRCGALPTSSETLAFDLLREAGSPEFKALSRVIR